MNIYKHRIIPTKICDFAHCWNQMWVPRALNSGLLLQYTKWLVYTVHFQMIWSHTIQLLELSPMQATSG